MKIYQAQEMFHLPGNPGGLMHEGKILFQNTLKMLLEYQMK